MHFEEKYKTSERKDIIEKIRGKSQMQKGKNDMNSMNAYLTKYKGENIFFWNGRGLGFGPKHRPPSDCKPLLVIYEI